MQLEIAALLKVAAGVPAALEVAAGAAEGLEVFGCLGPSAVDIEVVEWLVASVLIVMAEAAGVVGDPFRVVFQRQKPGRAVDEELVSKTANDPSYDS